MASTNFISGLSSGFNWSTMIDQLIAIDHKRVDLISNKKTESETRLKEWQSFNTKLLSFKTAADALNSAGDFNVFKAVMSSSSMAYDAGDLLNVTTTDSASAGSYEVKIKAMAAGQKLSSASFTSRTSALGASYTGDVIINGTVISIAATDTLTNLRDKINNASAGTNPTGVSASIISYGTGDYRLILTSDETGAEGIGLSNGGAADIVNLLGFGDNSRTAKNHIAGGDMSDRFTSTSVSIKSLLGLSDAQASLDDEIVINGLTIDSIDLNTDTLSSLQMKLQAAGLSASISEETEGSATYYRLLIGGASNTYTDSNNILETLGFIKAGVSDVYGVTGDVANTSAGAAITANTLIKDIDGYTGYAAGDYIHLAGTDSDGVGISDDTLVLSNATTVQDLLDKIESIFGDVTATIDGNGRVSIIDNTTGTSPLSVQIAVKNNAGSDENTLNFDTDDDLGDADTVRKRQLIAGADSLIEIDGVTVSRSSNTIDDILSGVTFNLLKADADTTITLGVQRDIDAIVSKVNSLVTNYNAVASYINTQSTYDATKQKTGGILFGDGTLSSVKFDLTSLLVENIWGVAADFSTLGLVGVNVDMYGQLKVDESTFRSYLNTNFNDVRKLFTADGTTSVGTLSYIGHGNNTKQGEYAVNITQAATKSTSAGDATSLSGDETLMIEEKGRVATIRLTNGMAMSQVVNAINDELGAVYAEVLAGGEPLYADSEKTSVITASTKWDSVYNSAGISANVQDDDVISFSGTLRDGRVVNGSYTIDDASEDSVQNLLSAIETAFENEVTASINSSGRILITDKTIGNSNLSLSFDMTQAHDLNFGTVESSNTDGQEGRYMMSITASLNEENHLVLSSDNYGSAYSFTIHQENNLLWTEGDQTVDNGLDVEGTINGEAATGAGQILKGNSGNANVDGLSINYTGTSTGEVGTVKLTLGVAEQYNRALYTITDSIDGYVSFKQQSLSESITKYEKQINDMEAVLEKKRNDMINQYVRMELALQKIQSQGNWLSGQLSAAESGWK